MSLIFGAIAIFVALCALWLASNVNRNLEVKSKYFADMHMQSLSNSIDDNVNRIEILQRRVNGLEKIIKGGEASREISTDKINEMEKFINDIRAELIAKD